MIFQIKRNTCYSLFLIILFLISNYNFNISNDDVDLNTVDVNSYMSNYPEDNISNNIDEVTKNIKGTINLDQTTGNNKLDNPSNPILISSISNDAGSGGDAGAIFDN
ncbi:MAG: hypothetical protein OEZ01_13380, partial [Candidatus Heimdallarchaeota archaeon]|nr:hypothetical protein [Candidatus Heimdallarchaeota archaeon]